MTQFGRMCAKLGIRIIAASSPQAKGRVERAHGTHQDRLVKKLRLAGIASYQQANEYLEKSYLSEHTRRYAHPGWRPQSIITGAGRRRGNSDQVFWLEEQRVVSADWVVRYDTGNCNWNGNLSTGRRREVAWGCGKMKLEKLPFTIAASVCASANSPGPAWETAVEAALPLPPHPHPRPSADRIRAVQRPITLGDKAGSR